MHIHSFRGLTEVSLEIFSKINLFVGENNAGKTSLLEAIYLIANYISKQGFLRLVRMREQYMVSLVRTVPTEELISWLFSETVKSIEIEFKLEGVHKHIKCTLEE
ncbi:AAA family ATPase [Metasolibacillus meyeri]|uniref:AAA family ATPase n=1 Tax=Metasolibacillus meyeri TaxID=1071052 RepID=A0AAW9NRE5_9BACL|nr:AAA family ATPase [Metasolibacillus meyeri]MEC1178887.1 AAA family ATPase [Metasolibacillus meyeri]